MKIDQSRTIGVLDASRHCEPSGFLFNKAMRFLTANGYDLKFDGQLNCPVLLVNTCCVTQTKMREAEEFLKKALNSNRVETIVIYGCYSKLFHSESSRKKIIKIGPKEFNLLDKFFVFKQSVADVGTSPAGLKLFKPYQKKITDKDYFVLICQGCVHHCRYCNIKNVKGKVISRTRRSILGDIRQGMVEGVKEFVLLADDCGSYGMDLGTNLVELIKDICSRWSDIKLKISTFFPGDFIRHYRGLREIIKNGNISYINIPIQSGSRRILGLMNRDYDVTAITRIVEEIRGLNPAVWLYTHVLISFPTETRKEFAESLKAAFVFDDFLVLTYSDNPLTMSSKIFPKVNFQEQEERIKIAEKILSLKKKGSIVPDTDERTGCFLI